VTAPAPPSLSLEEARARLKDLGYLDGRVERFVFRRALTGRGGLFFPAVLSLAFAAALACAAAVETSDPAFGRAPGPLFAVFAHFFVAWLVPAALLAAAAAVGADRSRRPASGGLAVGLVGGGLVIALWIAGSYALGGGFLHALVWGVPVSAAALLAAESMRSGFLARAYAHSNVLPERARRGVFLAVAVLGMAVAASLFALRREPEAVRPPQPSGVTDEVRVIAVDGLELDGPAARTSPRLKELFDIGATGWWAAQKLTPPEIWMNLATGVPADRHGVRALERVRPIGSSLALRPPPGTGWYLHGLGRALHLVKSAPVSARDRRSLTFWEVCSSAGLPSASVGWWSSGPWPGASVVGNEEVLARAKTGQDVDRIALEMLRRLTERGADRLSTVYLPSSDILRADAAARAQALSNIESFLEGQVSELLSRTQVLVLIVLAVDSHPPESGLGRMVVFDRGAARGIKVHIRPEDVAPSILARAGIPAAADLPGRAASALFDGRFLETSIVPSYGPRILMAPGQRTVSDREYLEKLKSLGYLN
jgi:hypothetical protein